MICEQCSKVETLLAVRSSQFIALMWFDVWLPLCTWLGVTSWLSVVDSIEVFGDMDAIKVLNIVSVESLGWSTVYFGRFRVIADNDGNNLHDLLRWCMRLALYQQYMYGVLGFNDLDLMISWGRADSWQATCLKMNRAYRGIIDKKSVSLLVDKFLYFEHLVVRRGLSINCQIIGELPEK